MRRLRVNTRLEIAKLHRDLGATMIYVTHDQVEAMTLASKIVVLNHGRIEQVGAPLELYRHPRNLFVAGFIGSPRMNFIKGQVLRVEGIIATIGFAGTEAALPVKPGSLKPGDAVTVGIRPEHMEAGGEASRAGARHHRCGGAARRVELRLHEARRAATT